MEGPKLEESLYKRMQRTKYLIQKLKKLREMYELAKVNDEWENMANTKEQMKYSDEEYQKLYMSIKTELTGRYVYSIDSTPITYAIKEYKQQSNEVVLRRLFDHNGIILDHNTQSTFNQSTIDEDKFFSHYHLFAHAEEAELKARLASSALNKDHVIMIKYQTIEFDGEKECMPIEIKPSGTLKIFDYDIRYDQHSDRITEIRHK